jgi:hypothetical protein
MSDAFETYRCGAFLAIVFALWCLPSLFIGLLVAGMVSDNAGWIAGVLLLPYFLGQSIPSICAIGQSPKA